MKKMSTRIRSSTLPLLKYTRTRILQSRSGLYLELMPNGAIQTTNNVRSPFGKMGDGQINFNILYIQKSKRLHN